MHGLGQKASITRSLLELKNCNFRFPVFPTPWLVIGTFSVLATFWEHLAGLHCDVAWWFNVGLKPEMVARALRGDHSLLRNYAMCCTRRFKIVNGGPRYK